MLPVCDISKLSVNFCFSSLKAEEKRGGGGSHNWGTVKDELRSVEQQTLYLPRLKTQMNLIHRLVSEGVLLHYIRFVKLDTFLFPFTVSLTNQMSPRTPLKERSIHLLTRRTSV